MNLIRYADDKGHAHLLWVSDARSTRCHLVNVDSLDLAGVCFWVLTGGDDPNIWEAVRQHLARDVARAAHNAAGEQGMTAGMGPQAAREEQKKVGRKK